MSTGAPASDDSDMEPQPASDPEQYAHCTLCEFTGGENYKFQEILNFVADHCHEVHIDGLCAQVKTSLETEFQMTLSHAEIKNHFLHHQCDQKIVLNNILRDLVPHSWAWRGATAACSHKRTPRSWTPRPWACISIRSSRSWAYTHTSMPGGLPWVDDDPSRSLSRHALSDHRPPRSLKTRCTVLSFCIL